MSKAIFLDRDGTINIDKGYLYKKDDFEFIQRVPEAIKCLNILKYKVIVISNQSGIARGLYTIDDVNVLHKFLDSELKKINAYIDAYYFCPHHPDYDIICDCRKPKTGLIKQALNDFDININKSWMVGDKESDIECANNMNINAVFLQSRSLNNNFIKSKIFLSTSSLIDFVEWLKTYE